jgi:hypothetical protein
MRTIIGIATITVALFGCTKDPIERCVDAEMNAWDERNPDGVGRITGKSRAEAEAAYNRRCLFLSKVSS